MGGSKTPPTPTSPKGIPSQVNQNLPLTEEQIEILKTFRSELISEGHLPEGETLGTDDETLIRFLRARKFNLIQSKRMITQCLQWRHQVEGIGIDELYRDMDPFNFSQKEHVFKHWPMYYHRTDKIGRPISIQRFGSLDLNKLYSVVDKESHFRSIIVNCEALTREVLPACTYKKLLNEYPSSEVPKEFPPEFVKVTNAFCIVDLKGFTLSQFWQIKSIARICFGISQDYYPETMGYLAIINAPYTFATIFKAIQPWLSKETISKINILGDNYISTLLEHIEEEDLPSYLGGKCDCDPKDLGNCEKNDIGFEKSPWLKFRDWKQQSWLKFNLNDQHSTNKKDSSEIERPIQKTKKEEEDEVQLDGEMTQDGALIVNTNKKSHETVGSNPKPVTPPRVEPNTNTITKPEGPNSIHLPASTGSTNDTVNENETSTGSLFTAKSDLPSSSEESKP